MTKSNTIKKTKEATYLNQARRIVLKRLEGYKADVYLFGSYARGDHHNASDIDVAIMPFEPLRQGLLSEMREDLEESNIPQLVEIIDLSRAPRASNGPEGVYINGVLLPIFQRPCPGKHSQTESSQQKGLDFNQLLVKNPPLYRATASER